MFASGEVTGTSCADDIDLIDLQHAVEELQVRYGGFAHPDGADLLGFDEANRAFAPQHLGQGGGRHPSRGAAADDEDASEAGVGGRAQNFALKVIRIVRGTPTMLPTGL